MVPISKLEALLRNEDRNAKRREQYGYTNIDVFNRWRKWRRYEDAIVRLQLDDINLRRADLRGANFENVRFYSSDLSEADFEGANLRRADFDYTNAIKANFRNADMGNCLSLYKIMADGANFRNADLRGAFLDKRYDFSVRRFLTYAQFSGTKISHEQKKQLIFDFGLSEDYFKDRFKIIERKSSHYVWPYLWFNKKALKAQKKAEEEGRIFTEIFNGKTLEYTLIPVKGNEDLFEACPLGFSIYKPDVLFSALFGSEEGRYRGAWWYFVFDVIPEKFREFVAVHEFGEKEGGNHKEALKIEYQRVKARGLLSEYISWQLQYYPDRLIYTMLFVEGVEGLLPREVVEAARKIFPDDIEAWKRQQENRKRGFYIDIWNLAWKKGGLTDRQICEELTKKRYDTTPRAVRYYRERMEIPNYKAIRKLIFLEPVVF